MTDQITSSEAANLEAIGGAEGTAGATIEQQPPTAVPVPEATYDVKVNGQTVKVPLSELQSGYSRQQDYTRKTQELAQQRQQWDTQRGDYERQLQEVKQFFSDPRVQQALAQLQAGATDPQAPLTVAQAQQLIQSQQQQVSQQFEQRLQEAQQQIELKTLAANYGREIDATLAGLTQKHPVLADIEGFEVALRQKVAEQQPQTLQEAKQLFVQIAESTAAKLNARFQTQQKQAAAQQTQLAKGGIEPPGGAQVPLPPQTRFKIGSPELLAAALGDLTQKQ